MDNNTIIYLVTRSFPNETHDVTETFTSRTGDNDEAFKASHTLFDDLYSQKSDKDYIALWLCEIHVSKNQVWMIQSWKKPA